MRQGDIHSGVTVKVGWDPINVTATKTGTSVDLQDVASCEVVGHFGLSGDTLDGTNHVEFHVQESSDDSTFTAVANADILGGTVSATAVGTIVDLDAMTKDNTVYRRQYMGTLRYIRCLATEVGTLGTGMPSAQYFLVTPQTRPVANP